MASSIWQTEMNSMLAAFNLQVMQSLKSIKIAFKEQGLSFNPDFREYFLQASNKS